MNRNNKNVSRRSFIKISAAGAASMGLSPTIFVPRPADPSEGGFEYNPNLNPFRVAGVHDPSMTTGKEPDSPWRVQNGLVKAEAVETNIERLACALTEEKRPKDAWKSIFLKPAKKAWGDVTVAVKTNNIAQQHTRSAVMAKICKVLNKEIGIKAGNIFIYDSCHGKDMLKKTPFAGLPDGCNIMSLWGGFSGKAPVGRPWMDGKKTAECLSSLVEGKIDIVVNIAMCKGHYPQFGHFTMSMKTHLGTFSPRPHAHVDGATDYLFAINKTPLILGEMDSKKKKVLFPRQQLCLIDSLWASEDGPMCNSSAQPNRMFMGVFSPVLDYQVAQLFRKKVMGWPVDEAVCGRFLSEFGIKPSDLPEEGILDVLKTG